MLNLVFCAVPCRAEPPVTNLPVELCASRQLIILISLIFELFTAITKLFRLYMYVNELEEVMTLQQRPKIVNCSEPPKN